MKEAVMDKDLEQKYGALKESEERYRRMIEEVEEYAIIMLDKSGIIQTWNRGAEKIKQYAASEAVGRHFEIFYLPEDRAQRLPERLLHEAAVNGRAVYEGWRARKDGTTFWGSITLTALHDSKGNITGYSKVTRDLTANKIADEQLKKFTKELQQKNEELRKSEERYHKMIAEVQDYAIILLDINGDIQNWNAGARKIKGYEAEEIVGKNFRLFYLPEDRESGLPERLINEAMQNGKAVHEGWRMRKDGSKFWGSTVITALHNDAGDVIGFSKVTRDLTEKKEAEDKLQQYLVELQARNKELEQFAYIASHDLQEPLRKIQTFTEVIEKNLDNKAITKRYFEKITISVQRMKDLIVSVLNYSRLSRQDEPMVDTDLNVVIKEIEADFELTIHEKQAAILYQDLPVIKAFPLQMTQLFSNLISNALKFSKEKPIIRISSRLITSEEIKDISDPLVASKYYEIVVADNGIGFEQEYERLIFAMFQRLHTKQAYSGTGIGLALCKKIMENHRGFIRASSVPGKGACFYMYFPVS
jgi:PAS domain S-box-containing protein